MNVASKNYGDAKPSHLPQDDLLFEGKSRSDFERVKQKFDSRHSSKSHLGSSSKSSSRKSDHKKRVAKSSEMSFDIKNNMNIHENAQNFDCEASASKSSYQNQIHAQSSLDNAQSSSENVDLVESFNLDGFKVSEDDDVSSSFW
jgi:hypothetical protein